jgi:PKD repeat protein
VAFTYDYDGEVLKETIVLKEDRDLKFPIQLAAGSSLIPWGTGEWKIVKDTQNPSVGIVISKPFGTDVQGRYVEMNYEYADEILSLVYDKTARIYNQTLTEQIGETVGGIDADPTLVKKYDYVPISYPLTIDPTYHYDLSWSQAAGYLAPNSDVCALTTYDDGTSNTIYGGMCSGLGDALYKYNKTYANWSQAAAGTGGESGSLVLTNFNDGTGPAIFSGTGTNGTLKKYNATLGSWLTVATKYSTEALIRSFSQYNDGTGLALYASTSTSGKLLKYNQTLAGWAQVATTYAAENYVYATVVYDDGTGNAIFGGTSNNAYLLKYNQSLGGWAKVADPVAGQITIRSLTTYDDGTGNAIFGGTGTGAKLLKYNRTLGGWALVANTTGVESYIRALTTYDDGTGAAVYGGTSPNGYLLKYNRSLASWMTVANKFGSEGTIYSLTQFDDGNGTAIYGGTNPSGKLLKWNTYTTNDSTIRADFAASLYASSTSPMRVNFTDTSTGSPLSWNWSFGDGRYSSNRSPSYTYYVGNNYTVTLNVSDVWGMNSTKTKYINLLNDDDTWLQSWIPFNNVSVIDLKGNAWSAAGGAVTGTTQTKFGGRSLEIQSNDARIFSSYAAVIGPNDFEFECWIYPTVQGSTAKNLISRTSSNGAGTSGGWGLRNGGTTSTYSFWVGDIANKTPDFTIPNNQWTWLKVYRKGGNIEVYTDGTRLSDTIIPTVLAVANPLSIGSQQAGQDNYFYLDEFRLSTTSRETGNTTTPYAEYTDGLGQYNWININPDATLRYKTNPGAAPLEVIVYNQTPRNRTVQIQYSTNATSIHGEVNYAPSIVTPVIVRLNNTVYNDMTLNSWNIDSTNGIVSFTVSRAAGIKTLVNNNRTDLVDISMLYSRYTPIDYYDTYFTSGSITDGQHAVTYPIINFISTPVYFGVWNFTTNFTANSLAPSVNSPVLFTSSFTGDYPNMWYWDFGDGTFDNGNNASTFHSYATSGFKTVTLMAYLGENFLINSTKVRTNYINVVDLPPAPVASFTISNTSGTQSLVVNFTDTSINTPTSWSWSFNNVTGNNTPVVWSTARSPTTTFEVGNFSIILTATNAWGSNISTQLAWVNVTAGPPIPPVASFTVDTPGGINPITAHFTDTSTNTPSSWSWTFLNVTGNNTPTVWSALQNPTGVFGIGNFSIILTSSNGGGSNISAQQTFINVSPYVAPPVIPVVSFMNNVSVGTAPLVVQFTDTSSNTPTGWNWSFRNITGNNTQVWWSQLQNPVKSFGIGNYSITLNASNGAGEASSSIPVVINVGPVPPAPVANFTADMVTFISPMTVQFTDTSSNSPTEWNWSFGDSTAWTNGSTQNPTHFYSAAGNYTVKLRASNANGGNLTTKTNYIWAKPPTYTVIPQMVLESQEYLLTLTFRDSVHNTLIKDNISVECVGTRADTIDSEGVGIIPITSSYGILTLYISAENYIGQVQVYLMDQDLSDTIYLVPAPIPPTPNPVMRYNPHQVRFIAKDYAGQPVKNVRVYAQGFESTANASWITAILGIDLATTAMDSEVMTGTTGSDGAVVFLMLESIQYHVNFTSSTLGVSESVDLFPKEDSYLVMVGTTATGSSDKMFGAGTGKIVRSLVSNQTGTKLFMNLSYLDAEGYTTSIYFYTEDANKTPLYNTTYIGASHDFSYVVDPFTHGATYYYGFTAQNSVYGPISGNSLVTTHSRLLAPLEYLGWDTSWYTWITIICLICFVAMFSGTTNVYGTLLFPFWALFFGYIGWLDWCPWEFLVAVAVLGTLAFVSKMNARVGEG